MAMTPPQWRLMWRARGLALDRVLPDAFAVPMLAPDALRQRVPSMVQVPGHEGLTRLTAAGKEVVYDVAEFATGYVAQCLPAQVAENDAKLPGLASKLAVQSVGDEQEFVGSFDAVIRVRSAIERGPWHRWDTSYGAVDVKMTGASEPFGLNSPTMRRWLSTGRLVLKAARKEKGLLVGQCRFVAWLIRRPRGPTFSSKGGRIH